MRLLIIIQVSIFFNNAYGSSGIVDPSKLSVQHSYGAHGPFVERGQLGAEEGVYVDSDEFRKLIVEGGLYRLKISNGKQCIVTSVRAVSGVGWLLFTPTLVKSLFVIKPLMGDGDMMVVRMFYYS